MEIRILQEQDLANAAGLSRYVFDTCLRNRMEFEQTIGFVEEYLSLEHLTSMYQEGTLTLWGAYAEGQLAGISGMQSDGMVTMLYLLPQYQQKGYGGALLRTMGQYAKEIYGLEQIRVNATPAWSSTYFKAQGFCYVTKPATMQVPFIAMYAPTRMENVYGKRHVSGKVIAAAAIGCLLFATIGTIVFMCVYLL